MFQSGPGLRIPESNDRVVSCWSVMEIISLQYSRWHSIMLQSLTSTWKEWDLLLVVFYISVMWPKRSIIGNHLVHIPLLCAVSCMLTWGVEVMNLAWFNNQTILIWIDSPQTCRVWNLIINSELFCQTIYLTIEKHVSFFVSCVLKHKTLHLSMLYIYIYLEFNTEDYVWCFSVFLYFWSSSPNTIEDLQSLGSLQDQPVTGSAKTWLIGTAQLAARKRRRSALHMEPCSRLATYTKIILCQYFSHLWFIP